MIDRNAWLAEHNTLVKQIRVLESERNLLAGEDERLRELLKEAINHLTIAAKRTISLLVWLERARK